VCGVWRQIGRAPLLAFGLGAFAAGAAVRQLALSTRAARAQDRPAWRGLVGRANGGMIVHLGVVIVAVAFAASSSFDQRRQFRLEPGQTAGLAGHTVTYLGTTEERRSNKVTVAARVRVDGDRVFEPALHRFPFATQSIGSPSVRVGPFEDVYLTLVAAPEEGQTAAVIGVNIQPLVVWLWIGGGVMALGTLLAAWPGRARRRPEESPATRPVVDPPSAAHDEQVATPSMVAGPHG
jgi:cytochrome c-type biogenesis protein CcmF